MQYSNVTVAAGYSFELMPGEAAFNDNVFGEETVDSGAAAYTSIIHFGGTQEDDGYAASTTVNFAGTQIVGGTAE